MEPVDEMSDRKSETGRHAPANDHSARFDAELRGVSAAMLAENRANARTPTHRIDRAALSRVFQFTDLCAAILIAFAALALDPRTVWPLALFLVIASGGLHSFSLYRISPTVPPWDRLARSVIAIGLAGLVTLTTARLFDPAVLPVAAWQTVAGGAGLLALQVIYAFAIATMAFTAKAANPGQIVLAGIALFMVSDIILAQERFTPLANSMLRRAMPYLVWFLYFAGQALIVYGMIG